MILDFIGAAFPWIVMGLGVAFVLAYEIIKRTKQKNKLDIKRVLRVDRSPN